MEQLECTAIALRAPKKEHAAPAATTSQPPAAVTQPPAAAAQPKVLSTQVILSLDSSFRERCNYIKTNSICFRYAYGHPCRENPFPHVHGLILPGYYESATTRTIPKPKTRIAALTP